MRLRSIIGALALLLFVAPRAVAQVERPGVPEPVAEPNVTLTFHGVIEFEADVRPAGASPHSHAMLIETLEIAGVKNKEGWGNFVSAFTDATTHAWLTAIPGAASGKKGKVIVTFALHRDGSLAGALSLAHSSGDASIDAATRIAIAKAAPFAPLPQKFAKAVAQLRVTFAYDHPRAPAASAGGSQ
ncbi:MAG TPA: energy transducer TonB [Candidatus Acidoferrales bacterium]|nr:energy transducer TonB [Candidatus Acidoferrales bacterium]